MASTSSSSKQIFGLHEKVYLQELGITLVAKLDTGAASASLSAKHIAIFEEDGTQYVKFDVALNPAHDHHLTLDNHQLDAIVLPLAGYVQIKRRHEDKSNNDNDYSVRPSVKMTVGLGNRVATMDVNLTDRRRFRYPLLLGARSLAHLKAIIDPAQSMTAGAPAVAVRPTDTPDPAKT